MYKELSNAERIDWLRLLRTPRVGPLTFWSLLKRYKTASAALDFLENYEQKDGKSKNIPSRTFIEDEISLFLKNRVHIIGAYEQDYPYLLRFIPDAPPLLFVQGSLSVFNAPLFAIVGSRNASGAGLKITHNFAHSLCLENYRIVSGLARGIDTQAHKSSLQSGTIAVIAGGHKKLYPAENISLAAKILEHGGTIVSEMPLNWEPRGQDFPRRNRIISGLSYGILVVEGALKSGSMITAHAALDQGREIFAVPGSPLDQRSEGPNSLIRNGATLVMKPEHILSVLQPILGKRDFSKKKDSLSEDFGDLFTQHPPKPEEKRQKAPKKELPVLMNEDKRVNAFTDIEKKETSSISSLLSATPIHFDDLLRLSTISISKLQAELLDLELEGKIIRHAGNFISVK